MSRKEFFLMGLLLGMAVVGFCWGMNTIERNINQQLAGEAAWQLAQQ